MSGLFLSCNKFYVKLVTTKVIYLQTVKNTESGRFRRIGVNMNQAYKLIWNISQQAWVVVSELATSKKKSSGICLKSVILLSVLAGSTTLQAAPAANALPTGETIASGSASFDRSASNQLTVNQGTSKLITNWNSFDIGVSGKVAFVQPSSASIALNRINTGTATQIFGQLNANGQVVIVNPSGITFGAGSQVTAASIIGSVLNITDSDFNNNTLLFSRGNASKTIDNQGSLTATAGSVALLAPGIINGGTLTATAGSVSLANADAASLSSTSPGAFSASITQPSTVSGLVQNSGYISATQVNSLGGKIILRGDTSQGLSKIRLAGTLQGGVDVNGRSILVNADLNINGNSSSLLLTSSNGYSLANTAKLNLNDGLNVFRLNNADYQVIRNVNQLQAMSNSLNAKYVLAQDIDASATSGWNSGAGFAPIGSSLSRFTGVLEGLGHSINGLSINRPTTTGVALLGFAQNAFIKNIGLSNASIRGKDSTGALLGSGYGINISNCFATGSVSGGNNVGGLAGYSAINSDISNSYTTATVNGGSSVGGLVGTSGDGSDITNSFSSGSVSGSYAVGGLVGSNFSSMLSYGYASGNISGVQHIGGLVGESINGAAISSSYASGNVLGSDNSIGGLVGYNDGSTITSNYATGDVSGNSSVGGLLGSSLGAKAGMSNSYATGSVSGNNFVGGLIGYNDGDVSNSYWDTDASGQTSAIGLINYGTLTNLVGLNSSQMKKLSSFVNWGATIDAQGGTGSVWRIYEGHTAPLLRSFLTPLIVTVNNATKAYDGINYSGGNGYSLSDPAASLLGSISYSGTAQGARNAGSYSLTDNGFYSDQQHYDLTVNAGTLTINKANLSIGSSDVTKIYDGNITAVGTAVAANGTQIFAGDSLIGGTFAFDNRNAGTGKTVTVSGVTVNDGNGGNNYTVGYVNNMTSTIHKAELVLTSSDVVKAYDGTSSANGQVLLSSGSLFGTDSISGGVFSFKDKHAGEGKSVSLSGVTVNDGNSGNNYALSYLDNTDSTINRVNLVLSATDVVKVYDGNSSANAAVKTVHGTRLFGGDSVSGGTFSFDNRNAGTAKTVTISGVIVDDGNSGNNYNISYVDNLNSSISKASLVLSSAYVTKTYDGTTVANGSAIVVNGTQLFGSDNLSGGIFNFDNKHVGTDKHVAVSGVTVNDGNNGNNYNVSYTDNTVSSISKADLVLSSRNISKTYDGSTAAMGQTIIVGGTQLFDTDSLSGGTFAFANKNAGSAKIVYLSGVAVHDGNAGNNYNVSYAANTASQINRAILALQVADASKVYDGATTASTSLSVVEGSNLFGSDSFSGGSFRYADKHAGENKTLLMTQGINLNDGNNGNNYIVAYVPSMNSSISKAGLVLTAANANKVYDGTLTAKSSALVNSGKLFNGDTIGGGTFVFTDKNAGTGKSVSVSGVTVNDGNGGNNYNISYVDNTTSSISKRLLTIGAVADSKEYDGKVSSVAKPVVIAGRQRGDSIVGLSQSFSYKNAGIGKTLRVSGYVVRDGNNGGNYEVVLLDNQQGVISPKALTINTVANTKVYDGGVSSANKPLVTGLIVGDRITGLVQQYETKTVGENKKLLIKSGYVLQDGNSGGNYTVTEHTSTDGVITAH